MDRNKHARKGLNPKSKSTSTGQMRQGGTPPPQHILTRDPLGSLPVPRWPKESTNKAPGETRDLDGNRRRSMPAIMPNIKGPQMRIMHTSPSGSVINTMKRKIATTDSSVRVTNTAEKVKNATTDTSTSCSPSASGNNLNDSPTTTTTKAPMWKCTSKANDANGMWKTRAKTRAEKVTQPVFVPFIDISDSTTPSDAPPSIAETSPQNAGNSSWTRAMVQSNRVSVDFSSFEVHDEDDATSLLADDTPQLLEAESLSIFDDFLKSKMPHLYENTAELLRVEARKIETAVKRFSTLPHPEQTALDAVTIASSAHPVDDHQKMTLHWRLKASPFPLSHPDLPDHPEFRDHPCGASTHEGIALPPGGLFDLFADYLSARLPINPRASTNELSNSSTNRLRPAQTVNSILLETHIQLARSLPIAYWCAALAAPGTPPRCEVLHRLAGNAAELQTVSSDGPSPQLRSTLFFKKNDALASVDAPCTSRWALVLSLSPDQPGLASPEIKQKLLASVPYSPINIASDALCCPSTMERKDVTNSSQRNRDLIGKRRSLSRSHRPWPRMMTEDRSRRRIDVFRIPFAHTNETATKTKKSFWQESENMTDKQHRRHSPIIMNPLRSPRLRPNPSTSKSTSSHSRRLTLPLSFLRNTKKVFYLLRRASGISRKVLDALSKESKDSWVSLWGPFPDPGSR